MRDQMRQSALDGGSLYGSQIRNRGFNGYIKLGMPVGASVYDKDEQDEMRSTSPSWPISTTSTRAPTSD